jgi:hypothetical protein
MTNPQRAVTSDTGRFAMVPCWVLDALDAHPARAAQAVLLYARLSAEADYGNHGDLTIAQADLAERCRVSVDTLARTLTLLRDLGAVSWQAQGRAATYTVHRQLPAPMRQQIPHPCGSSTRTRAAADTAPSPGAPITTHRVEKTHTPLAPQGATADPLVVVNHFVAWWQEYPRKVAKPTAERAYAKAVKAGVAPQALLDGLRAWAAYWAARNEPEYVPHPSTWLTQCRWMDAPPPLPAARKTGTVQGTVDVARQVLADLRSGHQFGGALDRALPPGGAQ